MDKTSLPLQHYYCKHLEVFHIVQSYSYLNYVFVFVYTLLSSPKLANIPEELEYEAILHKPHTSFVLSLSIFLTISLFLNSLTYHSFYLSMLRCSFLSVLSHLLQRALHHTATNQAFK